MHSRTSPTPSRQLSSTTTQEGILTMSCIKISGRMELNHISATKTKCTSNSRWIKKQLRGCFMKKLHTRILESKVLKDFHTTHHRKRSKRKKTRKMLAKLRRDQQQAIHCQVSVKSPRLSTITSSSPALLTRRTRLMRCFHAT